ncbi:MAG: phosphatidate cytidylyltransferase [Treponema sp.]|jgi:phosphatidate cytidylyltransferase|nr:phosphatidate cytidylyltransferase [Treponema sp.]
MKKLIQRLAVFFAGVPLTVFIVAGLPQKNQLAANAVIVLLSALGALEFAGMLNKRRVVIAPAEAAVLGGLAPLAETLTVSFGMGAWLSPAALIAGACWTLLRRMFVLPMGLSYLTAGLSALFYPGLFMSWFVRMGLFPSPQWVMLLFLIIVIVNDSAAWAAGMLWGKGNQGIVPVSPNKSIAGFIGGFAASTLAGLGAVCGFPAVFRSVALPSPLAGLILGSVTGAAAALGDLAESAMKRGADIKDSGSLIPGRGGVLDSIDSIALAAPVFYGLYRLLF